MFGKEDMEELSKAFREMRENEKFLRVYTDPATGVQYVSTYKGGLAARIDKDGKPYRVLGDGEGNILKGERHG